jgi:hypothetical protein
MSEYYIGDFDYLQGGTQLLSQAVQETAINTAALTATGVQTQIVGFDASGNPTPKNVGGDANGGGLAFSGETLTVTLPQNLQSSGSPTFSSLNITNQGTFGDLKIGGGPIIKDTASGTLTIDPGSISGQSRGSVTATITGAAVGDVVILQPPSGLNAGLAFAGCVVTASDTLTVFLANLTGGSIDDGSNSWTYLWMDLT